MSKDIITNQIMSTNIEITSARKLILNYESHEDLKDDDDLDQSDVKHQLFTFKLLFGASRGDIR